MIRRGIKLSMDNATYKVHQIPTFIPCVPAKPTLCAPPASEIDTEECGASQFCQGYNVTPLATTHWEQQLLSVLTAELE